MIKIICVTFFIIHATTAGDSFPNLDSIVPLNTPEDVQTQAAIDVICRTIPERCRDFDVAVNTSLMKDGKDFFAIKKKDGQIKIQCSSGVACTWGFNYYLKNYCNCHIGWQTKQLRIPKDLPDVHVTITAMDRFRYYQNVCTTSYSFVWWDINKWRAHLDWMALNGINIALASHAQEAIWKRVYKKINMTDMEIDEHFSGPAFLSWQRMGNIRGWGGPLSSYWHLHSLELQHFIIGSMRNLSIIPVLPAFAGHVPRAFHRLFPNADYSQVESWNEFKSDYCCPLFLNPVDPLFNTIGRLFLKEITEEFGMYHVYNSDPFNENTPSNGDTNYIKAVGSSIYKTMSDVDSNAVWLLQGWMFVHDVFYWTTERAKALLTSVDKGKVLVLDLQSEQWPQYNLYEMYFGQPFIWCMLHNFGGTLGMFGDSYSINTEVYNARKALNSTMVGTGLTPEGINQNYVVYDLMLESSIRDEPIPIESWLQNYTIRRYGEKNDNVIQAWNILMKSVYNYQGLNKIRGKYVISRRPSLDIKPWSWYNSSQLFQAWELFLNATSLRASECYLHDLTDITRQALQYRADQLYPLIIETFYNKQLSELQMYSDLMMKLLKDLDSILSSNKGFLLGNWLEDAKSLAYSDEDRKQFEFNARNQITLWGPNGEIVDYANKQWGGMVSDFFALRWNIFLSALSDSVENNKRFNKTAVKYDIFTQVELPFSYNVKSYPTHEQGDTVEIAKAIFDKWNKNYNYPDVPINIIPKVSEFTGNTYRGHMYNQLREDDINDIESYIDLYDVVLIS